MKRLRIILLFLLLGAIVNVAVAWGCAIFANIYLSGDFVDGVTSRSGEGWELHRIDNFGFTLLLGQSIDDMKYYSSSNILLAPAWSQFADPPTIEMGMKEESTGWPLRTLSWFTTFTPSTSNTIRQHVWSFRERPNEIDLPLAPIWTGFAINTIFYALLLWMPFIARHVIRRKRGLCVKCAYDLRGVEHEACPECGKECLSS